MSPGEERVWEEDLEILVPHYGIEDVPTGKLFLGNAVVIAITLGILLNALLRTIYTPRRS
jgi:hypothetical protein